jgi:hypothetical protein
MITLIITEIAIILGTNIQLFGYLFIGERLQNRSSGRHHRVPAFKPYTKLPKHLQNAATQEVREILKNHQPDFSVWLS